MNKSMRSKPLENNRGDAADRPRAQRIAAIYRKLRADMDKVGADSESQIFLARRCAGLLALVEMWEQKFLIGEPVPTGTWNATVNTVRRLMQDIGLTRDAEGEPTPDLQEYIDQSSTPSDGADITPIANRRAG